MASGVDAFPTSPLHASALAYRFAFSFIFFLVGEMLRASSASGNRSSGRVVRASASGAVDLRLIPSRIKLMTLKLLFTASLLDDQH